MVIGATIAAAYMGAQKDFVSGANFIIWCNVSLTAAAIVACAPQLRTLFSKRLRKSLRENARGGASTFPDDLSLPRVSIEQLPTYPTTELANEKRSKHTPLILSDKFLSGDGKVSIGNPKAGVEDRTPP